MRKRGGIKKGEKEYIVEWERDFIRNTIQHSSPFNLLLPFCMMISTLINYEPYVDSM